MTFEDEIRETLGNIQADLAVLKEDFALGEAMTSHRESQKERRDTRLAAKKECESRFVITGK